MFTKLFSTLLVFITLCIGALGAQTITGPSFITLGTPATYTLSNPGIPAGFNGIKSITWRRNSAVITTQTCPTPVSPFIFTLTTNTCSVTIDAVITYYKYGSCANSDTTQTLTKTTNLIFASTNCVATPTVMLNGSSVAGTTLEVPCGCTTPLTFTTSATGAIGFTWSRPSGWTAATNTGATFTVTPNATSGGTIGVTATGPCCGITTANSVTIARTKPSTSFVNPPTDLCTPVGSQTFNLSNTLSSLCGATSFTYTISGNTGPKFLANNSQTLTTTAGSVQVTFPAGVYSVNLSVVVNYPCGASAASTIPVKLYNGTPPAVTYMSASRVGNSCYYDARITKSANVKDYYWSVNGGAWYVGGVIGNYAYANELFLGPGSETVKVYGQNPCNTSTTYTKNLTIPSPPAGCMLMPGTNDPGTFEEAAKARISEIGADNTEDFVFRVFPVPTDEYLYIESTSENDCVLSVYNADGKSAMENMIIRPGVNEVRLDMPSGVYFLNLTGDLVRYQTKIVVRK